MKEFSHKKISKQPILNYIIHPCNQFPKQMLNWCQNQHHSPPKSQILIPPTPLTPSSHPPASIHHIAPPKFITQPPKTIRKLRPNPRRNTQQNIASILKIDQQIQVEINTPKSLQVDRSTQTQRLTIDLSLTKNNKNNLTTARTNSPVHLNNSSYLKINFDKRNQQTYQRSRKPSCDLKINNNIRTRATHCLAQTNDHVQRCDKSKMQGFFGVDSQSYHLQLPSRSYQLPTSTIRSNQSSHIQPIKIKKELQESVRHERQYTNRSNKSNKTNQDPYTPRCIYEQSSILDPPTYQAQPEQQQSQKQQYSPTYPQSTNQLTLSSKYKQIYKNVESEFKHSQQRSQKRRSQRKLKINHNPRVLFQRQTIVSYSDQHRTGSKEMLIQQSVILQRQSRSLFTPLSQTLYYQYYSTYMAMQNYTGSIISIKEIPITFMDKISQELLVYKELQNKNEIFHGILTLYQTQIDFNSYLLIKEPYTLTLKSYLVTHPSISQITIKIQYILQKIYELGFYLNTYLKLQDMVVIFQEIKIQNASVFNMKIQEEKISIDDAILRIRADILQFAY